MSDLEAPLRPKRKKIWVDYFVQFRWILVIFVVLPISFTIYFLTYLGDVRSEWKSYKTRQKEHDENVKKVMKRLRQRNPSKDGLVCTARKPWIAVGMRNVDYKRARHFEVDLSAFRNVLSIDKERMVARVEPLVNMGQISRVTVPLNVSLAVVAELDDLTVGGLINGYGIEGSSHKYGLFSDTVVSFEIVLADGSLVRATKDNEFSDLYYAIPWSQGTLGLLVAAEIRLIPIKEYMKLTYMPVVGNLQDIAQAYCDSFAPRDGDQDNEEKVPDFVEGMIYSPTQAVMMTGRYASKEEAKKKGSKINSVGWWFKTWFYQHAETALKKGEFVEYIPTRQYYHRHTRCLYWEGKLILPFADQFWFRFLFGWLMPPKVSLLKATQGEAIRNYYHEMHVIQDMLVPLYKVGDALEWVHREMEVYPIWLCPHKLFKLPIKTMIYPEPGFELHRRQGDTQTAQMYTDIGVYYAPGPVLRGEVFNGEEAVRKMESWLIENPSCSAFSISVTAINSFCFSFFQFLRVDIKLMASFRRTLSPAYPDRQYLNGSFPVSSPTHKLSSANAKYSSPLPALAAAFQQLVGGVFTRRHGRKGKWRRAAFRCVLCFFVGFLLGMFPFGHMAEDIRSNEMKPPLPQANNAQQLLQEDRVLRNRVEEGFVIDPVSLSAERERQSVRFDFVPRKPLILVTPTYDRAFQAYFLNRLGQVLRLVPPPVVWIVVEMKAASMETAEVLRKTGVMYRHLVCNKNLTDVKDRGVHQRNTALEHIERHRLDGIVYFADDDNVYSLELFDSLRDISRFGTWPVAMLAPSKNKAILEGPVCNASQVIGWHTNEKSKRLRRFHVDMSGFAFNSTILWDPKLWRRPSSNPIRQLDTVKEGFQETTFIEQLVEDETQMEGSPHGCSKIMNWHLHLGAHNIVYPKGWVLQKNLDAVIPVK